MFERFAQSARTTVQDARYEAERRGDRRIGSDHLLLAVLQEDALARVVGIDAAAASAAADQLDRAALAAVGLNLGEFAPPGHTAVTRNLPLTACAKSVIQQALSIALAEKARRITSRHILLALLDQHEPDPAAALFIALSINQQEMHQRLTTAN